MAYMNIFDGLVRIRFYDRGINAHYTCVDIEMYKNAEALNCAKNHPPSGGMNRVRMDVRPE